MGDIHLINPLWDDHGGSEHRTAALHALLMPHARVRVWSEQGTTSEWHRRLAVRTIDARRLAFPRSGTLVFVGAYFWIGAWVRWSRPERIVLIYNTPQPEELRRRLQRLTLHGRREVELVYASASLKQRTGLPGTVQESFIDLERFSPRPPAAPPRPFTVGRLSRDVPSKHHPDDPRFYAALTAAGMSVRVMGGTCLGKVGSAAVAAGTEVLPEGAVPPEDFLASLDCFYYRTDPAWFEPSGRVITEAMAMGLPVVAHREGGYRDWLRHGENGFLFDTEPQALACIEALRRDPALRARIGAEARRTVTRIFSSRAQSELLRFYLGGNDAAALDGATPSTSAPA